MFLILTLKLHAQISTEHALMTNLESQVNPNKMYICEKGNLNVHWLLISSYTKHN